MKIKSFDEIIAWQKAQDLAVLIYKDFKNLKDFGFRDQILRAVVSISNNIAEGFDRGTDREFVRFLYIAKGSCSEVKSMLVLSSRIGYLEKNKAVGYIGNANEISRIIQGLIRVLQ